MPRPNSAMYKAFGRLKARIKEHIYEVHESDVVSQCDHDEVLPQLHFAKTLVIIVKPMISMAPTKQSCGN